MPHNYHIRNIPDDLYRSARIRAAEEGTSFRGVALKALECYLNTTTEEEPTVELDIQHQDTGNDCPLHPLYLKYSMQSAYVEIDCGKGILLASSDAEIGNAVPMDVWHNHSLRFGVNYDLTASEINDLLDEIAPLARRVIAGYTSEWDGSNHIARYSEEAQRAQDEIHELCETAATASYGVVEADDWLEEFGPDEYSITAETTDEELETIATQIEAEGIADMTTINGALELTTEWRDDLRTEEE